MSHVNQPLADLNVWMDAVAGPRLGASDAGDDSLAASQRVEAKLEFTGVVDDFGFDDATCEEEQVEEIEKPVWPKHACTRALQKSNGRVDAALLAFCQAGWEKSMSPATVRTNLKNAMEMELKLAQCEHSCLIERNGEHKEAWLLVQTLLTTMQEYKAGPTDEKLLAAYPHLEMLHAKVKILRKRPYCKLTLLFLKGSFLMHLREYGLADAVEKSGLLKPGSEMFNAFGACTKAEPTASDTAFWEAWLEALLEGTAKEVLRKMDVTMLTRGGELRKAVAVFDEYHQVMSQFAEASAITDAALARASGLKCLMGALAGNTCAISAIDRAVRSFPKKSKNELVKALWHYPLGQEMATHGEALVTRSAEDLTCDRAFEEAQALASAAATECEDFDPNLCIEKLDAIRSIVVRLTQALISWSDVRFSEQRDALRATLKHVTIIVHNCDFACLHTAAKDLIGPLSRTSSESMEQSDAGKEEDPEKNSTIKNELRCIRGNAVRHMHQAEKVLDAIGKASPVLKQLFENTVPSAAKKKKITIDVADLSLVLDTAERRVSTWHSLLQGIVCTCTLEVDNFDGTAGNEYPDASQEFSKWQKGDKTGRKPYLLYVMEMSISKAAMSKERALAPYSSDFIDKELSQALTERLDVIAKWLLTSPIAKKVAKTHCEDRLRKNVDAFFQGVQSDKVNLVDQDALAGRPGATGLELLVAIDIGSAEASSAVDHLQLKLQATDTSKLPHLMQLEVLHSMLAQLGGVGMPVARLQRDGCTASLSPGVLATLLEVHASVHTCIILGCWVHKALAPASEILGTTVEAARLWRSSCVALEGLLSSDTVQQFDLQGLHLKMSIAQLTQWSRALRVVVANTTHQIKEVMCNSITDKVRSLESKLPQHDSYLTDTETNETMVKTHVLGSPDKDKHESMALDLRAAVQSASQASSLLRAEPGWEADEQCKGTEAMATACEKKAYMALAVTAACNVVVNFKKSKRGPAMAKKVVTILNGPKFTDVRLPRHLMMLLENLSEGADDKPPETQSAPDEAAVAGDAVKDELTSSAASALGSIASKKRVMKLALPTINRQEAKRMRPTFVGGIACYGFDDIKYEGEVD